MTAGSPAIYLAVNCYGGLAQAAFMNSLMAFRAACAVKGVILHFELAGGEALSSRGRAAEMAKFLASSATHLVFAESDRGFDADEMFELVASDQLVAEGPANSGLLLIQRGAAQRMWDGYPDLRGRLGDMAGLKVSEASFVFEPLIEPDSRRYLSDIAAFRHRWRDLCARSAAA
jgi:hypothetical protein